MRTQQLKIRVAPSMAELMSDEIYAAYMRKRPRLPGSVQIGEPWRILARRPEGASGPTWACRDVPLYDDAYRRVAKMVEQTDKWADVVLISKRRFMAPPKGFEWDASMDWCGRCRRPTIHEVMWTKHPGLRGAPVIQYDDELRRCIFCGVRREFGPKFEMRF
jgi:hypothetical protein